MDSPPAPATPSIFQQTAGRSATPITANTANANVGSGGSQSTTNTSKAPPAPRLFNFGQSAPQAASELKVSSRRQVRKPAAQAPPYGHNSLPFVVGPTEKSVSFAVHETLARQESAFVEAVFRSGWKEAEERVIYLPEHESEHFQIFVNFIYARHIFSSDPDEDQSSGQHEDDKEWERLAQAYALGAYLQAADFKDAIIDAIIDKVCSSSILGLQNMHQIIYPNSPIGSGVRRLLVDIAVSRWPTSFLKSRPSRPEWSDFFQDIAVELHARRKPQSIFSAEDQDLYKKNSCLYHEHINTTGVDGCYRTKYTFTG